MRFVAQDSLSRPLQTIWSCGNLDVGHHDNPPRAYPRCRLGDQAARIGWAATVTSERMTSWRAIAERFGRELEPTLRAVFAAKAVQLGAPSADERVAATRDLRRQADLLLVANDGLLDQNEIELAAIGFPISAVKELTRWAMDSMVRRSTLRGSASLPDELLDPLAPDVRSFIKALIESGV